MLCGIPCVATNVGDFARVVGENDLIFGIDDDAGMSDKVLDILSLYLEEYNHLSLSSREHIKNMFIRSMVFLIMSIKGYNVSFRVDTNDDFYNIINSF